MGAQQNLLYLLVVCPDLSANGKGTEQNYGDVANRKQHNKRRNQGKVVDDGHARLLPNADIGHPKLFIGGEESVAPLSPQPPVNNFAEKLIMNDLRWLRRCISGYPFARLSRLDGSGLLTLCRFNDYPLYRPTRRAGFDLLTTTQRPSYIAYRTLLYCRRLVKPAGRSLDMNHQLICTCL